MFEHGDHSLRIKLADGRTLAIAFNGQVDNYRASFAFAAGMVLATLLLGSYLAAQRITRRLEKLERGVTRFGEGRLDVRVHVRGRDEIARLAFAFNRSFDRICRSAQAAATHAAERLARAALAARAPAHGARAGQRTQPVGQRRASGCASTPRATSKSSTR